MAKIFQKLNGAGCDVKIGDAPHYTAVVRSLASQAPYLAVPCPRGPIRVFMSATLGWLFSTFLFSKKGRLFFLYAYSK